MAGAVNAVLRKHASAADTSASGPRLAECVHVLCRWRDHVARQQDESECPLTTGRLAAELSVVLQQCAT